MEKLKLEFNPYTYTRVQVMRTKLFKKPDYDRLLKLDFKEIADYLGKTTYRTEMDKLGLSYDGADLIEHALSLNYKNTVMKIKQIADPDLCKAYEAYLLRHDYHLIKILLRSLISETDIRDQRWKELTMEMGSLKKAQIEHMKSAKTVYEVLQRSRLFDLKEWKDLQGMSGVDLNQVENRLDKAYYKKILDFSDSLTEQGQLFAEFLRNEIDILNILSITKLLRKGMQKEEIKRYIIPTGDPAKDRKLDRMTDSQSLEDLAKHLKRTPYQAVVTGYLSGEASLLFFKTALYRQLLSKTIKLLHKTPLTVNTIIGFALLKEVEVQNLKTLVKGVQLGVPAEQIEEALVL